MNFKKLLIGALFLGMCGEILACGINIKGSCTIKAKNLGQKDVEISGLTVGDIRFQPENLGDYIIPKGTKKPVSLSFVPDDPKFNPGITAEVKLLYSEGRTKTLGTFQDVFDSSSLPKQSIPQIKTFDVSLPDKYTKTPVIQKK